MSKTATAQLVVEDLGDARYQIPCAGSCGGAGVHVVTIGTDVATCDCPAGVFGRSCKHAAAVAAHLTLAPPDVPLRNAPAASGYSTPQPAAIAEPGLLPGVHGPCEATIAAGPGLSDVDVPPPEDPT